jgi:hypothetical protein
MNFFEHRSHRFSLFMFRTRASMIGARSLGHDALDFLAAYPLSHRGGHHPFFAFDSREVFEP